MEFTTHFELHSQTTRLVESTTQSTGSPCQGRDSHPLWRSVPRDLYMVRHGWCFSRLQLGRNTPPDFKFELFPLHSPLLGESLLVSFPPLNNMLKFRGSSHFIWGLIHRCTNLFTQTHTPNNKQFPVHRPKQAFKITPLYICFFWLQNIGSVDCIHN